MKLPTELPTELTSQLMPSSRVVAPPFMAPSAICEELPGTGSKVWHGAHIRSGAVVGRDCILGNNCYIDEGVTVWDRCKIGNGAQLFGNAIVYSEVFIGPNAMLINDKRPSATNSEGELSDQSDWKRESVIVRFGASIGAGAIIMPGITIGENAMIGAGSVVTKNVPSGETWAGLGTLVPRVSPKPYPMDSTSSLHKILHDAISEKDWDDVVVIATELRNTEGSY